MVIKSEYVTQTRSLNFKHLLSKMVSKEHNLIVKHLITTMIMENHKNNHPVFFF